MARDERRDPGEMYPGGKTYGKPGEAPDRAVNWESVVDKPTTYPPEKHRHKTSEVDGLNASLEQCVRKVEGKGLSTCDYTQAEKAKLSRVEDGANKTIIDASLSTSSAAADAKAVGDKIADCMTKVTTLKINDEWRFSVGPGISGEMAIRLEHLEFPSQGIWGIYTAMTIPTGLGTLAKFADVPKISTTFTSADAGKAADAKAVGEALMGKVDAVAIKEKFLPITDVNGTYDLSSYTIRKHDGYCTAYDASGNAIGSWRMDGTWMAGDAGIRFNGRTPPGDIPMLTFGATISDIADATKLTPVFGADGRVTGYRLGGNPSPVLLTDDAKAALFAGADFIAAVKKYGGTQIKEDEKGFYYEVDEEA